MAWVRGVGAALPATIILIIVGILIGVWILAGAVHVTMVFVPEEGMKITGFPGSYTHMADSQAENVGTA